MYLRTITRKNKDGTEIKYYQLAHNERDPKSKKPVAKIIHSFDRADQLDMEALIRLCKSIARVCGLKVIAPDAQSKNNEKVKKVKQLFDAVKADLLKLLAFQIGHEVSLNELGNTLGLAKQTVERYLELLEKAFVIKKVRGFSRNLRNEISKSSRYYFLDNGIRNALINNFNYLSSRNDIGMLWENFLFWNG